MRPRAYQGMATGAAVIFAALAASMAPPPELTVAEWAAQERRVSAESGSPHPGPWSNDRVPYAVEPMECLSFTDPCQEVTFAKSHQIAGTEIGVNFFGYAVDHQPCPILIVLPTIEEGNKYERTKLQPTIKETPALRHKVKTEKSRGRDGSTVTFKRFRGGYAQITGANSSAGLQMISVRVLIADEISEWPETTGNRGDPLAQAEKRLTAWKLRGAKAYYSSTPSIKGICRITAKYESSDQRRYYVPCPHCGVFQVLTWDQMKWRSETAPHRAYLTCKAHGCTIEHFEKRAMVAAGLWIKTYPDADEDGVCLEPGPTIEPDQLAHYRARASKGHQPGFHLWQAYSPFVTWDEAVGEFLGAQGNHHKEQVFIQQVLGEAYEESGEAPDHEKLYLRREDYPLGQVPAGALVLTGMADVQVNRIEWAVYAWGIGMTGWLADKGIVEGDPAQIETWAKMDAVVSRRYEMWNGRQLGIEAFGVDSGYLSNMVYLFARKHERVYALDGRGGHQRPAIGTPQRVKVTWQGKPIKGGAMLWPTGTWSLKAWVYGALRKTIAGPDLDGNWPLGVLHFPDACDQEFFKQITAEYLKKVDKKDAVALEWLKPRGQANEQLDIAVGALAMAWHLGLPDMSRDKWAKIAEERGAPPEGVQRDLATLWAPRPGDAGESAPADQMAATVPQPAGQAAGSNDVGESAAVKRARKLAQMNS